MKLYWLILSMICCLARPCAAQLQDYAAQKEKVYVHFNHTFFMPGDAVYYKIYVTRGADLRPSFLSGSVFVEWFSPDGRRRLLQRFTVQDGFAEGSFRFGGGDKGGIYKVRAYTNAMRNETDTTWFSKDITLQRIVTPRLLLQLDWPQKGYCPGAEVTASLTARTLADQPVFRQDVQFVVKVDGQPQATGTIATDADGKADIRFRLPDSLRSTDVILLATLRINDVTESLVRSVPVVLNKIDLQFLPEGGTLVAGFPANIAFRAVDELGKPAHVSGVIVDQQGDTAVRFDTYRYGMGQFLLTPAPGKRYFAKISGKQGGDTTYALPHPSATGVAMQCGQDERHVTVRLSGNHNGNLGLIFYHRDEALTSFIARLHNGKAVYVVPTDSLPAGIIRIRLQSHKGGPIAERRVFVGRDRRMRISIQPDREKYLPRQEVNLKIITTDPAGKPLPANVSLAVADDKLWTFADDRQDNLLSWLLFSSELRGKVEEPAFYFKENEPQAAPALDLVMLTHGYRYFEPVPAFRESGRPPFGANDTFRIIGAVLSKHKVPMPCKVYLYHSVDRVLAAAALTDSLGRFAFTGVSEQATYTAVAGPLPPDSAAFIQIFPQEDFPEPPVKISRQSAPEPLAIARQDADTTAVSASLVTVDLPQLQGGKLEEVVTVGYGTVMKKSEAGAAVTLRQSELTPGLAMSASLQGQVAGVQVLDMGNPLSGSQVAIRGISTLAGNQQPLVVINGMPASLADVKQNMADIASITVLKDHAATALYGSRAANGVIIINSYASIWGWKRFRLYKPSGYVVNDYIRAFTGRSWAERFYTPFYGSPQMQDDFRETIFWAPTIFTDAKGEATVTFRNSDANSTFRIIAEGIGYEGTPGRTESTYAVESRIAVELRVPKELLSGDSAVLQLHLKNNDTSPWPLKAELTVPESLLSVERKFITDTLRPGELRVIHTPAVVKKAGYGAVTIAMQTGWLRKDRKTFTITARERGFPMQANFTGVTTATGKFTAEDVVPGTLRYTARVFDHTDEQLEEGLRAMLREPHGCFEQVSSVAHPNVLILQTLEASGHAREAVRSRAVRHLESGYAKLLAFEVPGGGFEWFGSGAASTLLTAYGLLQFTDMQRYITVDSALLQRTRRLLLARRNGKGGFSDGEGIVRFEKDDGLTDSYVVYALAEAGLGDSVRWEYRHALERGLQAKNAYETAIVALAAHRLGRLNDFQQLVAKLDGAPRTGRSPFYSWGGSAGVESAALRALAWSRIERPPVAKIAREIAYIMDRKQRYGYGSTQATVMALKAMMAYARFRVYALEGPLALEMDGKVLEADGEWHPLAPGTHLFDARYAGPEGGKPYLVEAEWRVQTPPSQADAPITMQLHMDQDSVSIGATVRMKIEVRNTEDKAQAMTIASIAIPGGLQWQPWQLKEWTERREVAYYEIFDGYFVLYWRDFKPGERKILHLDLKADFAGKYRAQAGSAGLYYVPEQRYWHPGAEITVLPAR